MANNKSEIILAPTVDPVALKKTTKRVGDALDDTAKKAGKDLEKETERGTTDGTKKGVSDGMEQGGKKGLSFLKGGLITLAAAVAAAATSALSGLDSDIDRMVGRLELARDLFADASAFGVSQGQYAQGAAVFQTLGYDSSDLRGMVSGFAAALNDESMVNYKGLADSTNTLDAMLSFIKSTEGITATQQAKLLNPIFGDDDTVKALALLARMGSANSLQGLFTQTTGLNQTAAQLDASLSRTAAENQKLNQYRGKTLIRDLEMGGTANQVIQFDEQGRRVERASDQLIDRKLQINEMKVTAQIANMEATSATINITESALRSGLELLTTGFNNQVTQERIEKADKSKSGEMSYEEKTQYIFEQTLLTLSGVARSISDLVGITEESKGQQDYTGQK